MKSLKHTAKKIIAVSSLASAVAFASISFAQDQTKPEHCENKRPDRLVSALNVQADQTEDFHSVMQGQHEKRQALKAQFKDSHLQERDAMDTLHASTLESLKEILSEQQLQNFKAITLHNHPEKGGRKHMKGPQRMESPQRMERPEQMAKNDHNKKGHKQQGKKASEHMIATLDLSDDKADAFREVMKAQGEQGKSIREQYKQSHQAEHQAMKALFEDTLVQLESVLDEQQINSFKAIQKHNRRV
ncbi:MAG: hypothetical protein V7785_06920 [Bermanella sp.]